MSGAEAVPGALDDLPSFELDYGFDDPDHPTEVTIFAPDAESVTTSWLSIDAAHAVSIEDLA
jgi:hypothetical protein